MMKVECTAKWIQKCIPGPGDYIFELTDDDFACMYYMSKHEVCCTDSVNDKLISCGYTLPNSLKKKKTVGNDFIQTGMQVYSICVCCTRKLHQIFQLQSTLIIPTIWGRRRRGRGEGS